MIVARASNFDAHILRKRRNESSRRFTLLSSVRRSSKHDTAARYVVLASVSTIGEPGYVRATEKNYQRPK